MFLVLLQFEVMNVVSYQCELVGIWEYFLCSSMEPCLGIATVEGRIELCLKVVAQLVVENRAQQNRVFWYTRRCEVVNIKHINWLKLLSNCVLIQVEDYSPVDRGVLNLAKILEA